jgi:hypothetical protein
MEEGIKYTVNSDDDKKGKAPYRRHIISGTPRQIKSLRSGDDLEHEQSSHSTHLSWPLRRSASDIIVMGRET